MYITRIAGKKVNISNCSGGFMKRLKAISCMLAGLLCLAGGAILAQTTVSAEQSGPAAHAMNLHFKDLKWEKLQPELGKRSAEITTLRVDPNTKATHLMIRVPKDFHVPKHWHTANETHTVVKGTFIIECEGKRETLTQGSWNYVPSKMAHEAWTKPNEGALLYITVDSAWDINWVCEPTDFLGGRKN